MHVVLFEGQLWPHMAPLSLSRPAFALASGTGTLLDKQLRYLKPSKLTLWVRPEMVEYCKQRVVPSLKIPVAINAPLDDEPALVLSGRTLHFADYEVPPHTAVCLDDENRVRSAYVVSPGLSYEDAITRSDKWLKLQDLPHMMPQSRMAEHAWDLLNWNEEALLADFVAMQRDCVLPPGPYHVLEQGNVCLGKDVKLSPGVVLDGSKGPVILGDGVSIGANAVLQGPCFIGAHSIVSPLANIRAGTSIGPMCKVGGEISNSIFIGRSNKSHEGFVGDSYIGEWVNLGAGTNTSNLKNTYDVVSLPLLGTETPSGRRFLGSVIGDHTKIAIGTRLNTGSYIGYGSMIAASSITPRYVPSYTFLTDRGMQPYRMDKSIEVMTQVMSRRGLMFGSLEEEMAQYAARVAKEIEKPV
ncbi:MAG TPA: putative sugar nucleotidyl transferase [Tepidisphaeraceae bacterium]|jgi:UDP-N-acetylglucosamine diphosphorylase/glucosamine-1-phosphate N-acetyltransferase|nr:putative sugar nucleotidyl transferase [Tepidisphaeraceae bacterium]